MESSRLQVYPLLPVQIFNEKVVVLNGALSQRLGSFLLRLWFFVFWGPELTVSPWTSNACSWGWLNGRFFRLHLPKARIAGVRCRVQLYVLWIMLLRRNQAFYSWKTRVSLWTQRAQSLKWEYFPFISVTCNAHPSSLFHIRLVSCDIQEIGKKNGTIEIHICIGTTLG